MTTSLTQFAVKTVDQIRGDMLRTYANELQRRNIPNPNVSLGTEIYARFQAIAVQLAVAEANLPIQADALMADSAQGADLQRIAAIYGLALKAAGPSAGGILLANSGGQSLVILGAQLLDSNGQSYKVTVGGLYNNGDRIPIASVSTGISTNLAAGISLRWVSPPAFASSTALVSTGGLTGGTDAETIEGLRARLLNRLRNPPAGGNAAQLALWAQAASTSVVNAFVYPCINGGASVQVCVCGAPTLTNKTRAVDSVTRSTIILPYLVGQIPEYVELTLTTSTDVSLDVSIGLSLPISAAVGGPGGGWLDGSPWPSFASQGYADVTAFTDTTHFSVNSDTAPVAGVTRIAWLSPFNWTLYTATVLSFTGTGPYAITIDQPMVGMATGQWIVPQAAQSVTYFNTILAAFASMGPGELTNMAGLLPRALRKPLIVQSYPSTANAAMLRAVEVSGVEVLDTSYLYRSATTQALPGTPANGPNIFIPRRIGTYPI